MPHKGRKYTQWQCADKYTYLALDDTQNKRYMKEQIDEYNQP